MSEFEAQAEEQAMEAEALESIFVDDFEQVSVSPYHWKVKLQPFPAEDEENHVIAELEAKIPPEYPNEVPELTITSLKGLTDEQVQLLTDLAKKSAEENVGMAMIYTIGEEVKEWLLAHNEPPQENSMFARMQRRIQDKDAPASSGDGDTDGAPKEEVTEERARELEALERNRQKVLEGTPVNPDTFAIWKANFESTILAKEVVIHDKKSGKEYFAVGADLESWSEPDDKDEDGNEEAEVGGVGGVFAAEVFDEDDDLSDFSDMEDDDEDEDDDEN